ncbi:hypothetical protein TCAL_05358 [Tigriopus californicus]|uniref:Translocation protein SEC62 n=1 Tax=Tigriopus californicus TaxID=6832 RepID=A0A553NPU0_TIGCA|nr:translocation protein SEC62-like [Tigriopus californicus]TRY67427.1 hypothetical protein TCAL_05358 [Tigriopus californicus]
MSEKKVKRTAKRDNMSPDHPPSKLQKSIIHWVRRNVPTKKTKFLHSHVVEYFAGSKAIDALVHDSPWSKGKAKEGSEIVFDNRESAVEFMDEMLKHKMFHRAKKIPVQEKPKKKAGKGKDKEKEKEKEKDTGGETDKEAEKQKRKRKIRLDMHLEQVFLDTSDAFVWLYDPIPWYYWAGGTAIVLGIIAVCLFPLWPPIMRKGVHYLSIAAASFLVFIIALGVFKYIIFAVLFALSGGKLKFWIFPNLTEDVGFLESFMPPYDYTYSGSSKKKAKDSDDEESDDEEEEGEEGQDKPKKSESDESDESSSKKSSTGKDFEIVDKNDTDADGEEEND